MIPWGVVVFAHGLEGRPDGRKGTALREAGFKLVAPDGRNRSLADRVRGLEAALRTSSDVVLVGSSYGGLAAVVVASRQPERLRGLVLLAPALVWSEPPVDDPDALTVPSALPCIVIHGTRDEVIPIQKSRDLARRSPHIQLWERADDHVLRRSLPQLITAVRQLGG